MKLKFIMLALLSVSLLTLSACGDGTGDKPDVIVEGDGYIITNGDWAISNENGLRLFADNITDDANINAKLTANILLSTTRWIPIGTFEKGFSGTFDGSNHTITKVEVNRDNASLANQGFFGYVDGGVIKNLRLDNITVKGSSNIGIVAGYLDNNSVIENVSITGTSSVSGITDVGGIAGYIKASTILAARNTAKVAGWVAVGGIVGGADTWSTISTSYNAGEVTGIDVTRNFRIGGIAGSIEGAIIASYNAGNINASNLDLDDNITTTYDGIGHVVGIADNDSNIAHVYYLQSNRAIDGISSRSMIDAQDNISTKPVDNISDLNNYVVDLLNNAIVDNSSINYHFVQGVDAASDFPTLSANKVESVAVPITCYNPPLVGYEDNNGTWQIYSETGLRAFANEVTTILDTDLNAKLICNIELDNATWTAIGTQYDEYIGTFDGDNHTISNIEINRENDNSLEYQGFFAVVGDDTNQGTVKNLVLEDVYAYGANSVGGLVGLLGANSVVENVSIIGNSTISGAGRIGGIVGDSNGDITDSNNSARVTGITNLIGGITGRNSGGNITNSYNIGEIVATTSVSAQYIGGIAGQNSGEIMASYNTGNVTATSFNNVGGLVGENLNNGYVTACYNTGDISGNSAVGGIVGNNSVAYEPSARHGVSGVYNLGNVTATNVSLIGGIYGNAPALASSIGYFIKGGGINTSITSKTGETSVENILTLNNNVDGLNTGVWSGLPYRFERATDPVNYGPSIVLR